MANVRALVIENGLVVNAVLASEAFATSQGWRFGAGTENADIGWTFKNGAYAPPAPTLSPGAADLVEAERDRRIDAGMDWNGTIFQTDTRSRELIDRSRISAQMAIMGGAQAGDLQWPGFGVDFFWIAADNSRISMDAQTMAAFGNAAAAREGLHIVAASNIKKRLANGEALNIGDNALWPA